MQEKTLIFLLLNLDTVVENSAQEKLAKIWQIEPDGIRAKKFEAARIVFAAVAVVDVKAP